MPAAPSPHLDVDQLAEFAAGKLPEEQAALVAAHLADCGECRRVSEALPPDSFAALLRAAAPASTPEASTPRPGAPPQDAPVAAPPELLASGKYEVLAKLGEGGMGSVWKARHLYLDCLVAIKVMSPVASGREEARERFLQEMRAAGKLRHRHIVRAFDAEPAGDLLLLVMEYVDGIDLDRLVRRKSALPVGFACRVIAQAAEGLQHAHEMGMVHRDVKPANLMVTRDTKEIKILDFGLARLPRGQHRRRSQTQYQTFLGTPEYVAPEQAADARSADIRSDLYSLGCTLYFLLAGRPPFRRESVMETLLAHVEDDPPPLAEVPADLAAVVARLLAKKPADRFQTPGELAEALWAFAEMEGQQTMPSPSRVLPPPLPVARVRGRRLAVGGAVAAGAVTIALALVVASRWPRSPNEPPSEPPGGRAVVAPGPPAAPPQSAKPVSSTFEGGNDGWVTLNADDSADATDPIVAQRAKSPVGKHHLSARDVQNGKVWGWHAPAKYRGEHSGKFGKLLRFDLWTSHSNDGGRGKYIHLRGAGLTLVVSGMTLGVPVAKTWKTYRVRLDPTGGWQKLLGPKEFTPATAEEIKTVLKDVRALWIRGEFSDTRDTGRLANVVFGADE